MGVLIFKGIIKEVQAITIFFTYVLRENKIYILLLGVKSKFS
jgi:hypothetical protein